MYGFTTGSCAAAAAKASAVMALENRIIKQISIMTPRGIEFEAEVLEAEIGENQASCAVKKYAGDDPDVTDGLLIFAEVRLSENKGIRIDGGKGVGRVTKAGLFQKIGEAAINRVPQKMISAAVLEVFELTGYKGGAEVIISVPEGEERAKKTFNPDLGIVGGISILGTSGIVEPMSTKAIIDSMAAEMRVKRANEGETLLMAPGNYGAEFIKSFYGIDMRRALKCSNFIGEAVDMAQKCGFTRLLLIGHMGKLVKLSGGIMDTHSRNADCRMELIVSAALEITDDIYTLREILACRTTEAAADILIKRGILEPVMEIIIKKAEYYMNKRAGGKMEIGIVMFSNEAGILGETKTAAGLIEDIKENL